MDLQPLGELLVEAGTIERAYLRDLLFRNDDAARRELETLVIEQEEAVAEVLAERSQTPALVFATSHLDLRALSSLPTTLVRDHTVLPLQLENGVLTIAAAVADPGAVIAELGVLAGARIVVVVAIPLILELAIDRALSLVAAGQMRLRGARCRDDGLVVVLARPPLPATPMRLPRADSVALALQAVFADSGAPLKALKTASSTLGALRLKHVPASTLVDRSGSGPVTVGSPPPAPPPAAAVAARPFVMIVEDDAAIARLIATTLLADGYDVVEVASGDAVGAALRARRPDLVVLDAMLPGVRGFEICAALKHSPAWSAVPVVMVSAVYRGFEHAREIQEVHGADAFIEKPFKIERLRFVVADLLARPQPPLPASAGRTLSHERARALVDHHMLLGDVDAAAAVVQRWLNEDPLCGRAWLERGHLAVQQGDAFAALQAYELASTYERELFVAHLSLAMLYEQLGFSRRARATWEKAANSAPDVVTGERIREALRALEQRAGAAEAT